MRHLKFRSKVTLERTGSELQIKPSCLIPRHSTLYHSSSIPDVLSCPVKVPNLRGKWKYSIVYHSIKNCTNLDTNHLLTICTVCFLTLGPLGFTWIKHYCTYDKGSKTFTMSVSEMKSSGKMVSCFFCFFFLSLFFKKCK